MKRTFLHFLQLILLAICFITGCQGGKDTVSRLEEAETLIYESPDSALRLLEPIPHPERLQGKEQADYALLLSLARYRCYIPASSDSLIQIAVQYYKDKNEIDKGGTDGLIYVCTCSCVRSVGTWFSYTSDGNCPYEDAGVEVYVGYNKCASGMAKCFLGSSINQ